MKAEFTQFNKGDNWCKGTVGDFLFEAKSFDNGSQFGIDGGRVSKLVIKRKDTLGSADYFTGVVVNYDRSWDVKPTKEFKAEYDAVMELLETAPKRF